MDETLIISVLSFAGGAIIGIITSNRVFRRVYRNSLQDAWEVGYATGYKRAMQIVISSFEKPAEDEDGNGH